MNTVCVSVINLAWKKSLIDERYTKYVYRNRVISTVNVSKHIAYRGGKTKKKRYF